MSDIEAINLLTEIDAEDASRGIQKAVSARHSIARKYVLRLRKRHPDATPAQIIRMLERHYAASISTAGAAIAAGAIAADVAISLIPVAGAAAAGVKSAGQQAAKQAGKEAAKKAAKEAAKHAAKGMALGAAKSGAQRVASLLPAGDEQLQFEITAIFGLAIADIHGMDLDRDQAHALVYGMTNGRVSQHQIATMASDLAQSASLGAVGVGQSISAGRGDWSHWATTLSNTLPGGAAQDLVRTIQTGQLNTVRENLSGRQQASIEYGVGALAGGVTRFVFGREVIEASRDAFAAAPDHFPDRLSLASELEVDEEGAEPNRALAALEDAAKSTGNWIAGAASNVGSGAASALGTVTRPFRSVDLDGDGVVDAPQAVTAVRGAGAAIASTAGTVGGKATALFRRTSGRRETEGREIAEVESSLGSSER